MLGLLIADKDAAARKQMANLLIEAGYDVTVTDSAARAISGVLKKTARVVLLGTELDEFTSAEIIPLLKEYWFDNPIKAEDAARRLLA